MLQPMAIVTFQGIYELAVVATLRCVNEPNRGCRLDVWGYKYVDILQIYFQKQKLRGFQLTNNRQQIPLIYTFHTCLSITKSHRIFSFSDDRSTHSFVCILGGGHARVCRVTAIQLLCELHEHEHLYCIQYKRMNLSIDCIKFNTPTFVENTTRNNFD